MARRGLLVFVAVLTIAVGCDHATKEIAVRNLDGAGAVSVAGDTVRLELARNPGAFLSLGAELPDALRKVVFLLLVPGALAVVCVLFLRSGPVSVVGLAGLGAVAGGGLGNWIDRLAHDGAVTDFVSLGAGPLRTGIFNLADVWILAGIGLLLALQARR